MLLAGKEGTHFHYRSYAKEKKRYVCLSLLSRAANGITTGIFFFSFFFFFFRLSWDALIRICASAISSSFNYKVNEILDDFSLQEK
jgi:hypothetical protein